MTAPPTTAAPTPTPTPTAAPAPSYEVLDFSRDRSFDAFGLRTVTTASAATVTLDSESPAIGFDYQVANRGYHVFYFDEKMDFVTVPVPLANFGYANDYFSTGDLGFNRSQYAAGMNYAGYASWRNTVLPGSIERKLIFGAKTRPSDFPATGVSSYLARSQLSILDPMGRMMNSVNSTDKSFTIDWPTRRVTATILVEQLGSDVQFAPFTLELSGNVVVAIDNQIIGTASGGGYSGRIIGNVFGPAGVEAGLAYRLEGPAGQLLSGVILGRQLPPR
ncbi:hypothetical protein Q9Q95_03895 [Sphingomonas sp. DG1-23]|uniref:hypothetical protein n=1 Tax=Sphingomonas sp. DG1-23 TaxID=3068316 RepID=UPI0027400135|nr:hypothetical protein [Sphingomonas sp. DG1-23]MDP5278054.1 hypothetical protein [Sphingomonas sp. DG1-23]